MKHLTLDNIIFNASGPRCTTSTELKKLDKSNSCIVLTKSTTLEFRDGNESPRYFDNEWVSINSMGLPNKGIDYYISIANEIEKPYFISVAGLNIEENIEIIERIIKSLNNTKIDGIEINVSCPNIIGKNQLAYDFDELDKYLNTICKILENCSLIVGVKLPPYFEISHFKIVGTILNKYTIDFITCINSIGNGLIVNHLTDSTVIKPKKGCGGIGGSYIKPIGLSNVWNFYNVFKEINSTIKIIGCGGITNGIDAYEYILCGADLLQIGTQYYKEDVECFYRINSELKNLMNDKNYYSTEEFKGKLKIL
jgi:dihydroorotate dehydrogenase (fumarate)